MFLNMDAVVQPEVAILNAPQRFEAQGNLTDEAIVKLLRNLVVKARHVHMPLRAAA